MVVHFPDISLEEDEETDDLLSPSRLHVKLRMGHPIEGDDTERRLSEMQRLPRTCHGNNRREETNSCFDRLKRR